MCQTIQNSGISDRKSLVSCEISSLLMLECLDTLNSTSRQQLLAKLTTTSVSIPPRAYIRPISSLMAPNVTILLKRNMITYKNALTSTIR